MTQFAQLCRLAHFEVLSLIREGYFVLFEWRNGASWYVSLRHRANGNRAMVRVNGDGAQLYINSRLAKTLA